MLQWHNASDEYCYIEDSPTTNPS